MTEKSRSPSAGSTSTAERHDLQARVVHEHVDGAELSSARATSSSGDSSFVTSATRIAWAGPLVAHRLGHDELTVDELLEPEVNNPRLRGLVPRR